MYAILKYIMKKISILILILISFSFSDPYTLKRISDSDFRYEFYTTDKKIKPKSTKTYYWFKGGLIHSAQAGVAGELLNGKFTKMFHSNQLAEQGEFRNGLKIGLWRTWHANGIVETTQYWNGGLRTGLSYRYDKNGEVIEKGSFKANKKHGTWIDSIKKDTVIFKNGTIVSKKLKVSKEDKAKLKEERQKAKKSKRAEKEAEKNKKLTKKSNNIDPQIKKELVESDSAKSEKRSFFKRIFGKKQTKQITND